MSRQLISRSDDLRKLRDDGYDIAVDSGYLLVRDVPYVNAAKQVQRGILVSTLTMSGDRTGTPDTHVAMLAGEYPCDADGREIDQIRHASGQQQLTENLTVDHSFSAKPAGGGSYADYYEKMKAYVALLEGPAQAIDPGVTANTFAVQDIRTGDSVFKYTDTASSRAGILMANKKLELSKVAIIGLGGTGSYVLDLVAKTPVKEVHLYDSDTLFSHNAFRSPGAPSIQVLRRQPRKVEHFAKQYSPMRKGIVAHDYDLSASNLEELQGVDFAFVCIDSGAAKRAIIERLETLDVPFVDVGMGVDEVNDSLTGIVTVTTSVPNHRDRFRQRVSLADRDADADYDRNIQIADLNMLNAALAVIRWKKLFGFYDDHERELHSSYTVNCNMLLSEDQYEA
jgi:hypothetical protein